MENYQPEAYRNSDKEENWTGLDIHYVKKQEQ
jgi:hypothetical protein